MKKAFWFGVFLMAWSGSAVADHLDDMRKENRRLARQAGYTRETHNIGYGQLNSGGTAIHRFTLDRNRSYRIYGDCDEDCSDLDFTLYDENGNIVADDELNDDVPIVDIRPRRTARFKLEVNMHRCSVNPCRYAVQIFSK